MNREAESEYLREMKMLPGMEFWHPGGTKNIDFSTAGPIVP